MKYDVCCVGHMCIDILVKPVDSLPDKGKLKLIDTIKLQTGGCAMNTSIGLSKLGIQVCMVGKVGDDGFGIYMQNTLDEHGVNTDGLIKESGGISSASVVTIGTDGERSILHCLGTNSTLCFEDIDLETVYNSRYLFIGGSFLTPRFDGKDAAKLFGIAQKQGIVTCLDTAWDSSGKWLEIINPCLKFLDWFMPSIEEAEQMLGTRDPRMLAQGFKALGVKNVVIKLGSEGCYVEPDQQDGEIIPIFKVNAVDMAGAGDAWCAGFLSALVRGMPLHDCALFGNAVGSLCVTEVGTTAGIKSYAETIDFMRNQAIAAEE